MTLVFIGGALHKSSASSTVPVYFTSASARCGHVGADALDGIGPQAGSRTAKKIGRQGQTCSPDCDRLSIQP
jgi:hypothetical protein